MKRIGLVGGISWASTLDYYRYINEDVNEQLGGLHFAECLINSVDFHNFQQFNADYNWDATYGLLVKAALELKRAGAEAIVLCANTAHIVADRVADTVQLPLIHIVDATAEVINKQQMKKVGLLGTTYTMELDFYKDRIRQQGIEPIIPASQVDRDYIEDKLRFELGRGIVNPATKEKFLSIIDELIDQGAEGIILGCTEIPILIKQADVRVPVFDTTRIHAKAAALFSVPTIPMESSGEPHR